MMVEQKEEQKELSAYERALQQIESLNVENNKGLSATADIENRLNAFEKLYD
jgi:hypothetical protein